MKLKEKIKNMNPKKAFRIWFLCVLIFCIFTGIGTAVKFGGRIPEVKSQMETIEKKKDGSWGKNKNIQEEKVARKEFGKEEKSKEYEREIDMENIINFTTSDYVFLGIVVGLASILFAIYWIYTTAYVISKAWQFGMNAYLFGGLTFVTNLFGVICFWIYIRCHSICPKCGKLQPRKANNCSNCGTAIYIKCPDCDTRISVKDAYCSGCGRKMIP